MKGLAPIGAYSGWMKSFTNVPTLATQLRTEWVEVNGATISDVESPLNGVTLPDLNAANYIFTRGQDTSGALGGSSSHCHCTCYPSCCCACADRNNDGSYYSMLDSFSNCTSNNNYAPMRYYDMVFTMRVK